MHPGPPTCIPPLIHMSSPSFTCPIPHTHVPSLVHMSQPLYTCPSPCTHVPALVHMSQPLYTCPSHIHIYSCLTLHPHVFPVSLTSPASHPHPPCPLHLACFPSCPCISTEWPAHIPTHPSLTAPQLFHAPLPQSCISHPVHHNLASLMPHLIFVLH